MEKVKALSSLLEPFILVATFIGFGATVATKNYIYLAVPSISSIPIVALSRAKSKDDIISLTNSRERKIEKLRLEQDIRKQSKIIEKLNQQVSVYAEQEQKLKDYQARVIELEQANVEKLRLEREIKRQNEAIEKLNQQVSAYVEQEQKLKDYQTRVIELEQANVEKLRLEREIKKQNEAIEKLNQQVSAYAEQEQKLKDYQARVIELEQANVEKLRLEREIKRQNEAIKKLNQQISGYAGQEQKLKEYQARISELEQASAEKSRSKRSTSEKNKKIKELEQKIADYQKQIDSRIDEIVFDRTGSRKVLIEALTNARQRLILVCPWLSEYGIDDQVESLIITLLQRGVQVCIGWGHLSDLDDNLCFNETNLLNSKKSEPWKYKKLPRLKEIQCQYNNLHLKLLGTHEKYLVCDYSFAMISSHNFLTSDIARREREISLKTNDRYIIDILINRYEN